MLAHGSYIEIILELLKNKYLFFTVSGLSVVSAWRTSSVTSSANPVPFTNVGANIGNMWNTTSHTFTMKAMSGVFYVAMNAGAYPGYALNFVLQKSNQPFTSCSHSYASNYDTTGRDLIQKVKLSETLHFYSGTRLYSSSNVYTDISIFNIGELMTSDPVIFSVARDSLLYGIANPVTFSLILENEYSHYDIPTSSFTAPSSGIYFFSFSVGTTDGYTIEFVLYINGQAFTSIIRESTTRTGTDVIGRSIMTYLNAGDKVHIANEENKAAWSSQLLETSFGGFKYEPAHNNSVRMYF